MAKNRIKDIKNLKPNNLKDVFVKAFKQAIDVSWLLIKVYVPLAILTYILKGIGFIDFIAPYFAPMMKIMGLPGETAITLIAGMTNNVYAAIATLGAFDLTARQITIIAVVVGMAHSLFVETGILMQLGIARVRIAFFRIVTGILTGCLMNLFLPKNLGDGKTVSIISNSAGGFSWVSIAKGITMTCVQIILIIFSIMIVYELVMLLGLKKKIKIASKPISTATGLSKSAVGPWVVGFFIGITYGAGILLMQIKQKTLKHKDACLITIFLCLAHAIIEDTFVFAVVGGSFWWIIFTRVIIAFIVVRVLAIKNIYKKFLWVGVPEKI